MPYQPAPFLSANSKYESITVISVIVGSTREGRFSEKPAKWILQQLKKREGIDARLLDLRDFPMPFFDQSATLVCLHAAEADRSLRHHNYPPTGPSGRKTDEPEELR